MFGLIKLVLEQVEDNDFRGHFILFQVTLGTSLFSTCHVFLFRGLNLPILL